MLGMQAPSGAWLKFEAPDKSFSLQVPTKLEPMPRKTKDTTVSKKKDEKGVEQDVKGQIITDLWLGRLNDGLYLAGVTDYPVQVGLERELDLDRDNFLKAVDATLVSESKITQNGYAGREFTATNKQYADTFKSRIFTDGWRSYQIVAREPSSSFDGKRVDAFLQSFQIAAKPK